MRVYVEELPAEVGTPTNTSTNTSTDLISRQEAIETFIKWGKKEFGYSDINREERFIDAIHTLPTVEPERPRGEWVEDNCSNCGQYVYHGDARNFCPNCGADMRGDKR